MKLKVSNLLTTFAAIMLLSLAAQAQEELPILETQDAAHREFNLNEDKSLIYERNHSNSVKDSLAQISPRIIPASSATKTPAKPDTKNGLKEANDDALSFNFLYYMLQKFKMSDLIDQH